VFTVSLPILISTRDSSHCHHVVVLQTVSETVLRSCGLTARYSHRLPWKFANSVSKYHVITVSGGGDAFEVHRINPLNAKLNPICYLLALLGAHHFLHVSRIRVTLLTLRLLMSYIYIYMEHLFLITHNDAAQSVGLLWTSDQLVAEPST